MKRVYNSDGFLLQKNAYQGCISVPNNSCFNDTLEYITVCSSQNIDKGSTPQRMSLWLLQNIYLETGLFQ